MATPCVLGIDAGGTKTVALLADPAGNVVAEARGAGANLQTHGELAVEKVLHELIDRLSAHGPAAALCLGIAGVDRARDEAAIRGVLRRLGHREKVRVVNDALIALVAGAPGRVGIVVLAGTGSIAYGLDARGRSARAGGYGHLLADEGSAYWLGCQAIRATVRAADGRAPNTLLSDLVFEALGVGSVAELVPLVYESGVAKYQVAALAPLVERARAEGDVASTRLLDEAAQELALAARSVARQLALEGPFPVVLAGGAFRACPTLAALVELGLDLPGAHPLPLRGEPALGAVALALDLLR